MADHTSIEWTDATWNPVTGCQIVSKGCTNCYAMALAGTRLKNVESRKGLTKKVNGKHVWTGEVRFNEAELLKPLQWRRPRKIFVCAHGDLFAEGVADEWIDKVFAVMALSPQHTFQVLTKRPERMREYLTRPAGNGRQNVLNQLAWVATVEVMNLWHPNWKQEPVNGPHRSRGILAFQKWPLPNLWLGTSIEDQASADARIPVLLETPGAIRWISAEPLLGPVDLTQYLSPCHAFCSAGCTAPADEECARELDFLDWVVVGGESGASARAMHPDWARALRDQCAAAGVPFLFKQWGSWKPVPWKLVRNENETDAAYIERSEAECSQHAVSKAGYVHEMSHKPWSCERVLPQPETHQAMKKVGKKAAGRHLDGVLHDGYPKVSP